MRVVMTQVNRVKTRDVTTRLGEKVRAIRRQKTLSQAQLADRLGISPSYLNLIENNRRPLPAALLLRMAQELGVDLAGFTRDGDRRLDADLVEAFSDPLFEEQTITNADVRELVAGSPAAARAVLTLYQAYTQARDSAESLAAQVSEGELVAGGSVIRPPSEDVNDFVQARMNHFPALEADAERLWVDASLDIDDMYRGLARHLQQAHGITVTVVRTVDERGTLRRLDTREKRLYLSELLPTRSRSFQLAHQIALLDARDSINALAEDPALSTPEARALGRVALANYYAGAVLMPYGPFVRAARDERYDADVVGRRFRVGFEQVCHRFTTLRRPGDEGIPFHMIRIDVAGNISKRFSASGIHFARFSGACPKWNVFAAFMTPGMIRLQVSEMTDGERYFCLARTIQKDAGGFHASQPVQAIGLGCRMDRASELVYADGLDSTNDAIVVHVGVTCRVCDRIDCAQRAHPSLRHPLYIDENVRRLSLYMPPRGA